MKEWLAIAAGLSAGAAVFAAARAIWPPAAEPLRMARLQRREDPLVQALAERLRTGQPVWSALIGAVQAEAGSLPEGERLLARLTEMQAQGVLAHESMQAAGLAWDLAGVGAAGRLVALQEELGAAMAGPLRTWSEGRCRQAAWRKDVAGRMQPYWVGAVGLALITWLVAGPGVYWGWVTLGWVVGVLVLGWLQRYLVRP